MYKEYQCSGCVGCNDDCYEKDNIGNGCKNHVPGTILLGIGTIFLGLPKGFCRKGVMQDLKIYIFESFEDKEKAWKYDKFDIPVWKYLDEKGNTIIRGFQPRINFSFLHVIKGDCRSMINCYEITKQDIDDMD